MEQLAKQFVKQVNIRLGCKRTRLLQKAEITEIKVL
jgi:hypothetical protein